MRKSSSSTVNLPITKVEGKRNKKGQNENPDSFPNPPPLQRARLAVSYRVKYSMEGHPVCPDCGEYLEKYAGKWYCYQMTGFCKLCPL